jgi:hypothetical protein
MPEGKFNMLSSAREPWFSWSGRLFCGNKRYYLENKWKFLVGSGKMEDACERQYWDIRVVLYWSGFCW